MNDAITFDSHRFVKHMTKAGFTEQQAEAMAEEQVSLLNSNLATEASLAKVDADLKAEIARLEKELKAEIARIDAGLVRVENELKAEIAKVDADLRAEIARVEKELKVEIAKVETTIAGAKTETIKWVAEITPLPQAYLVFPKGASPATQTPQPPLSGGLKRSPTLSGG